MQKKSSSTVDKRSAAEPARQIRIIGGQWKRTPITVAAVEGLRPTPDRVRETLFNWLNHLLEGQWQMIRCLDLFAGTGALGFEAASRGVAQVLMIEENITAARQLDGLKSRLNAHHIRVQRADAMSALPTLIRQSEANADQRFNLIFLDPPYHRGWLERLLPGCERLLAEDGLVYAEAEFALEASHLPDWMQGWEIIRADRAGAVFFHLLRRRK